MDDRKLSVLRAIVSDYVDSMEPVGSKALVDRHNLGVSPATVRNDMAVLEAEGYITQPHTSAGRIPTDKGYRLFVDRLSAVKPLSGAERRAIHTFFSGAAGIDDVVTRTVRLLAQVTQQVAMVQYPTRDHEAVVTVELVSLTSERAMLIMVTSSGRVEQRVLELHDHDPDVLADVRARLNTATVGQTPEQAMAALGRLVMELRPDERTLGQLTVATLIDLLATNPGTKVVVGGVPNLTRFGPDFSSTLQPVLEALEEQVVLLRLLGEAASPDDVTVRIGVENPYAELRATSVVTTGYGVGGDALATLGVVGPTRMDYPATIASVRAIARYVSRFLSEG
ncbi:heat-inducible transcriptional repressor HrcA [Propionibacteriaceae bacterium Y2011]|uniref:heat-inducible transcriptional repressor HrcA n=1 Tax=Microlunatus sp. Y2014 TaxID=3418488 RepID=UPI003B4A1788